MSFVKPTTLRVTEPSEFDGLLEHVKDLLVKPVLHTPNFQIEKITVEGKSRIIGRREDKKSLLIGGSLIDTQEGLLEVTPKILEAVASRAKEEGERKARSECTHQIRILERTADIGLEVSKVLPRIYDLDNQARRQEAAELAKELVRLGAEFATIKTKIEGNPTLASEWERFQMIMKLAQDDKEDGN